MNRYTIKLRQFGTGSSTVADILDQNGAPVHQTSFGRNPERIAKEARRWVKRRERADLIAQYLDE